MDASYANPPASAMDMETVFLFHIWAGDPGQWQFWLARLSNTLMFFPARNAHIRKGNRR